MWWQAVISLAAGAVKLLNGLLQWGRDLGLRRQGRKEQRLDQAEASLEAAERANEIDEDVSRMSDDDLARRLRAARHQR